MLVNGDEEDVCLEGEVSQEVGEFCTSPQECESGDCKLTSNGYCENGLGPCLSDSDCGGDPCTPSPEFTYGTCVQLCTYGEECPEDTVCVPTSSTAGECLKSCYSLSDIVTCGAGASCEYGFPLGPVENGEGLYACRTTQSGQLGASCGAPADCNTSGSCLVAPGGGVCTGACGGVLANGLNYCDWGGACVSAQGSSQCLPLCPKGNVQCKEGFSCQTKFVGVPFPMDICLPD